MIPPKITPFIDRFGKVTQAGNAFSTPLDALEHQKSEGLSLNSFEIDRWKNKYFYPSDHYPIVANFSFN